MSQDREPRPDLNAPEDLSGKLDITVLREIGPGDPTVWTPQSYKDWESQERTRTFLAAWNEQVVDERVLRRRCAKWIFGLIALQVVGIFALVILQGLGQLTIDVRVLQILLPSVLGEIFGLGLLVVKYLFSQPMRHSLDSLAAGAHPHSMELRDEQSQRAGK